MRFSKFKQFTSSLIIPLLISCGVNMSDWPYVNLDFDVEDAKMVYIDYVNRDRLSKYYECYSSQAETVAAVYNFIESFHVSENITSKNVSDYNRKICFYFLLNDNRIYDFKAYYFSGATTYFMHKDELRLFPADFGSGFLGFMERNESNFIYL